MGTSKTGAQLAGKIAKAGLALEKSTPESVKAGGAVMQRIIEGGLAGATGGDRVLSHGTKARAKGSAFSSALGRRGQVGVRVAIKKSNPKSPAAVIYPTGAVGIVEQGAQAHLIGYRRTGRSRKINTGLLSAGEGSKYDHPVRGPIAHPGSKGKRAWSIAKARGVRPATTAMRVAPVKAVAKEFK